MKYAQLEKRSGVQMLGKMKRVRPEFVAGIDDDPAGGSIIELSSGSKYEVGGSGEEVEAVLEAIGDDTQRTMITQLQPMLFALVEATKDLATRIDKLEARFRPPPSSDTET